MAMAIFFGFQISSELMPLKYNKIYSISTIDLGDFKLLFLFEKQIL